MVRGAPSGRALPDSCYVSRSEEWGTSHEPDVGRVALPGRPTRAERPAGRPGGASLPSRFMVTMSEQKNIETLHEPANALVDFQPFTHFWFMAPMRAKFGVFAPHEPDIGRVALCQMQSIQRVGTDRWAVRDVDAGSMMVRGAPSGRALPDSRYVSRSEEWGTSHEPIWVGSHCQGDRQERCAQPDASATRPYWHGSRLQCMWTRT